MSERLTNEVIAEAKYWLDLAEPGKWHSVNTMGSVMRVDPANPEMLNGRKSDASDRRLIVVAVNALPALIAEVVESRAAERCLAVVAEAICAAEQREREACREIAVEELSYEVAARIRDRGKPKEQDDEA